MEFLKNFLKPKQSDFLSLLEEQGKYSVSSAEALLAFLKKPTEKKSGAVRQMEKDADEVQRILIYELSDTFVTPLDREDIFTLSRTIDNFVDYIYATVRELEIFEIAPTGDLIEMSTLLLEMANELHLALKRLGDHPGVASEHARRMRKIENSVENMYRRTIAEMFNEAESLEQLIAMLKKREVLHHLSNAADQGSIAADVIMDIGVKWY